MEEMNKVIIRLEDYDKAKQSEYELNRIKDQVSIILSKASYERFDKELYFNNDLSKELIKTIDPKGYLKALERAKKEYEKEKENN